MNANIALSSDMANATTNYAMSVISHNSGCEPDIRIFNNPQFGEIRTTMTSNGEPLFCLVDVCSALEIKNPSDVKSRLKEDGVDSAEVIDALGRKQLATFINEPNLYRCIFQSRTAKAEMFQDWVYSEVLPSIRKTGGYGIPQTYSEALMLASKQAAQIERQQKLIATQDETIKVQEDKIIQMLPKVSYVDMILKSPCTVEVTTIAQDYGMTAQKFNNLLLKLHIQHKVGKRWVLYKEHLGNGYVQSGTDKVKKDTSNFTYTYTRWTQRGRLFLYETLKKNGVLPLIEQS